MTDKLALSDAVIADTVRPPALGGAAAFRIAVISRIAARAHARALRGSLLWTAAMAAATGLALVMGPQLAVGANAWLVASPVLAAAALLARARLARGR